jgi:hypothetical protein
MSFAYGASLLGRPGSAQARCEPADREKPRLGGAVITADQVDPSTGLGGGFVDRWPYQAI